jgi:hypothetical protein
MSDELKVQVTLTAPVRMSWPVVIEPKSPEIPGVPPGPAVFSARFVFPDDHQDLATLKQAAGSLLRKLNPTGDFKLLRPVRYINGLAQGDFWYPFKTGDQMIQEAQIRAKKNKKEYGGWEDYMAGCTTLYAKSSAKYPPQLDVFVNGKWTKLNSETKHLHKDKFFNGMDAVGVVQLAGARLPTGGWGVTAYLQALGACGGEHIGQQEYTYEFIPSVTGVTTDFDPIPS